MKTRRIQSRIPAVMAAVFGVIWSGLYAVLAYLHGMPAMFDREFPFLISAVLGVHDGRMSRSAGIIWAFADGALVAFALTTLLVLLAGRSLEKEGGES